MTTDYILATRLLIPSCPTPMVQRTRLLLDSTLPLCHVCAPAGYGKTTLLASWAAQAKQPVAWLALDSEDNDLPLFLLHLLSALRTCYPDFAADMTALLSEGTSPVAANPMRALVNALCALPGRLCLMLDDLHVLHDTKVLAALNFLVEHQPPGLQLVLASRHEAPLPLARLRAQRRLGEYRATDLRFTAQEVQDFCNTVMHLELSASQLATLENRTEGWVVGLQLAALSLQHCSNRDAFIHSFAGDDRHVTDFLLAEVWRQLTTAQQDFLLRISVLERFSAPLCEALTGQTDSQQRILELERNNLFIISLDHRRGWYRFHALFASLLRSHLAATTPELAIELHHRASDWLNRHDLYADAVRHALQAGDYEYAAQLMEQHSGKLFSLGRLGTALAWASELPPTLLDQHPQLSMLCAWGGLLNDDLVVAERHVRAASAVVENATAGSRAYGLAGQLALIRSCLYCLTGDVERAMASIMDALGLLKPGRVLYRAAAVCLGVCHAYTGDLDQAERLFAENAGIADARRNLMVPVLATLGWGRVLLRRGQLQAAQQVYEQALRDCAALGWDELPVCGVLHLGLGELSWLRHEPRLAARQLQHGIELTGQAGLRYLQAWGQALLARLHPGQQALPPSALVLRQIIEIPSLTAEVAAIWLRGGHDTALAAWRASLSSCLPQTLEREAEYRLLARWLAAHHPEQALQLLDRLWPQASSRRHVLALLDMQLTRALALQNSGQSSRACAVLQQALQELQGTGLLQPLLEISGPLQGLLRKLASQSALARQVLELAKEPELPALASSSSDPMPVLSRKERLVARHIVNGATSQEIAQSLCVSLSTIKTHTQNIYAKLGVNKRLQAIERLLRLQLA